MSTRVRAQRDAQLPAVGFNELVDGDRDELLNDCIPMACRPTSLSNSM